MIYEISCIVIDNISFFTKLETLALLNFRNDEIMSLSHIVALLEQGDIPSIILDNSLTSSRFHDRSSFYKTRFSAVFSIRGLSRGAVLWAETLPSNYTLSSLFSRTQHCDSVSFSIHSNRINLSFLVFWIFFSFYLAEQSRFLRICDGRILPSNLGLFYLELLSWKTSVGVSCLFTSSLVQWSNFA